MVAPTRARQLTHLRVADVRVMENLERPWLVSEETASSCELQTGDAAYRKRPLEEELEFMRQYEAERVAKLEILQGGDAEAVAAVVAEEEESRKRKWAKRREDAAKAREASGEAGGGEGEKKKRKVGERGAPKLRSRAADEMRGHTSYLTFATRPADRVTAAAATSEEAGAEAAAAAEAEAGGGGGAGGSAE